MFMPHNKTKSQTIKLVIPKNKFHHVKKSNYARARSLLQCREIPREQALTISSIKNHGQKTKPRRIEAISISSGKKIFVVRCEDGCKYTVEEGTLELVDGGKEAIAIWTGTQHTR